MIGDRSDPTGDWSANRYSKLPLVKKFKLKTFPNNRLRSIAPKSSMTGGCYLSDTGIDLLQRMLAYNPENRISAARPSVRPAALCAPARPPNTPAAAAHA